MIAYSFSYKKQRVSLYMNGKYLNDIYFEVVYPLDLEPVQFYVGSCFLETVNSYFNGSIFDLKIYKGRVLEYTELMLNQV